MAKRIAAKKSKGKQKGTRAGWRSYWRGDPMTMETRQVVEMLERLATPEARGKIRDIVGRFIAYSAGDECFAPRMPERPTQALPANVIPFPSRRR